MIENINYTRKLTIDLLRRESFKSILDKMQELDYTLIYHKEKPELIAHILDLRAKLEKETDQNEKQDIRERLKRYDPNNASKNAILADALLDAADSIGFSLGADASDHYVYNGCYWKLVHRNLIKELLLNAALKTGLKEYSVKVIGQIESLLSQFRYSSAIPVVEYEKNLIKINLKNGTFVIKENDEPRLEKFSSDDFFKYQLPFNYDTEATAPKF
ncbi:hypothetical protein [Dysgonomonas sp. Marseille-P4361]|uniref:hypothetical protein n=1 Tax=Dysgonomonas sp. Marseille-P4361 TaxID=2161820 RepID=UPI000D55544C|nr:hypothetical protein [Dysgonomonas sp. Marseille-P4361]